jgi:MFS-type transporter involved in bile tolerance (Atg22 family)
VGALLATAALVVMPNSPYLWIAAGMLWILDASINVSMEPFRALVGDMLADRQRCRGYSMQSWFIGVGAVVASALPWILTNVFDVSNVAEPGRLPQSVKLALFAMWIYTTAAVTEHHYGTTDAASAAYNEGANWVGILFAAYNGFAALAALFIPKLAEMLGPRRTHLVCLWFGALGLVSIRFIEDPRLLLVPMIGVGIAWASILSLPYAMLSQAVPMKKMGIYMGIFNFFIVIPQILAASVLGILVRVLFGGHSIDALALGGLLLVLAGLATLRVDDYEERN